MALTRKPIVAGTFGTVADEVDSSSAPARTGAGASASPSDDSAGASDAQEKIAEGGHEDSAAATTAKSKVEVSVPVDADAAHESSRDELVEAAKPSAKAAGAAHSSSKARKPGRKVVGSRAEEVQRRHDLQLRTGVEEAYKSAKRRSKEWGPAPIRISAEAKARLARRREQDEEMFGVKFAETHYLDVAIANVPDDPEAAVQWVEEYLDTLGLKAPDAVGTTGRLRIETSARFDRITRRMRTTHGYGKIGHLQNAALLRLLDSLDRADEWNAPVIVDLDAS